MAKRQAQMCHGRTHTDGKKYAATLNVISHQGHATESTVALTTHLPVWTHMETGVTTPSAGKGARNRITHTAVESIKRHSHSGRHPGTCFKHCTLTPVEADESVVFMTVMCTVLASRWKMGSPTSSPMLLVVPLSGAIESLPNTT